MSCSSGSCTCGFVYKNKVRNSQASPSPPAPPYYPFTAQRSASGGGNVCLWWVGGQVVVRKMEGGFIAPPGPRRRKRQLEQLAREPLACLWFFLFFSTTPSPNPFLPPQNPYPTRPLPPQPLQFGVAWGSWIPASSYRGGRERGAPGWERPGSSLQRGSRGPGEA